MSPRRFQLGLTARGSALLTAGVTALVCGVALGQRDLVRVAVLLVAAPVVASLVVNRSRLSIACSRSVQTARVAPGVPIVVRIALRNDALLPTGALMLEDSLGQPFSQRARFTLDSIRGREQRSLAYQLPRAGRGTYRIGPLKMRLTDPFGLIERTRAFANVSEVVVLPHVDDLPDLPLPGGWNSANQSGSHSVGTHGSDDASIREYRYGDDLRKVHWRSTARLGSMMVRQEERPWHGRTTLLVDTRACAHQVAVHSDAGSADERTSDSFEWAVSATASIAAHLQGKGRVLDVVVGPIRMAGAKPAALLDQLAVVVRSDNPVRESMALADINGQESTIVAIFGALDETSLRSVTARRRPAGTALALLLDTASWTDQQVDPLRTPGVRDASRRAEVALTAAGWRVQRVESGATIADAWAGLLDRHRTSAAALDPRAPILQPQPAGRQNEVRR